MMWILSASSGKLDTQLGISEFELGDDEARIRSFETIDLPNEAITIAASIPRLANDASERQGAERLLRAIEAQGAEALPLRR
jgi:hypothetical protein